MKKLAMAAAVALVAVAAMGCQQEPKASLSGSEVKAESAPVTKLASLVADQRTAQEFVLEMENLRAVVAIRELQLKWKYSNPKGFAKDVANGTAPAGLDFKMVDDAYHDAYSKGQEACDKYVLGRSTEVRKAVRSYCVVWRETFGVFTKIRGDFSATPSGAQYIQAKAELEAAAEE